jgi:diguanylate cyclase (GGDEF)-like protein
MRHRTAEEEGMPTTRWDARARATTVLSGALVLTYAAALHFAIGSEWTTTAISNLGQLAAAAAASAGCWRRSRAVAGRWRSSWLLLAAATGAWAFGQLLWTRAELTTSTLPFPSWADAGFLLFPPLALMGLLVRPSVAFLGRGRLRSVLDATMVAASLFALSWVTSLGETYRAGAKTTAALWISLAYPVGDLVLITVALMVLAHAAMCRSLLLLVAGLVSMAIADSAFLYLVAIDAYATGALVDAAWVTAFVLIALSAGAAQDAQPRPMTGWVASAYMHLPYAMVAIGGGAMLLDGHSKVAQLAAVLAVVALIVRQLLVLLDNRRLLADVAGKQVALRRLAFFDELTGLANRALFNERLEHALALHERNGRTLSVLFCDLDDFKSVNDTLGHDAGDLLLAEVAQRLVDITRPSDTVARLGGDEFALLLEDDADGDAVAARVLAEVFTVPVRVAHREVPVRASIGVAVLVAGELKLGSRELVRRADVAMYSAKRHGKGTAVPYAHVMAESADFDLDLQLALARDIAAGDVRAALQPVYLMDGSLRGYEALARWRYKGRPVAPDVFIPIAERAGLLPMLDMAVIDQAIARLAAQPGSTFVSVNIGIRHLATPGVVAQVAGLMQQRGLAAHRLVVEVPEDQAIGDPEVLANLAAFRNLGVRLAMDDFGVGYSCLSRIGDIRPEIIKLDRSFVMPLDEPGHGTEIIAGIIELAHRIGAVVIGEGVETTAQLEVLAGLGCDGVQGYLLGRPEEIDWALRPERARAYALSELAARVPWPVAHTA